jgi:hypothetical protein
MSGLSTRIVESGSQQGSAGRERGRRRDRRRGRSPAVPRAPSVNAIVRASHEPKNLDISNTYTLSGTTGTLVLLNAITQGVTGNSRTGRQVKLDHLRLNFTFTASSAESQDAVRIIVLIDKESRGAAPAVGDVLTNSTFGLGALLSSHNFDNVPTRFKILADEVVCIQPTVAVNSTNTVWNTNIFHRLFHIKLKQNVHYYNTSAGTIADIDSGALYFITWGVNSSGESTSTYDSRLVFRDM